MTAVLAQLSHRLDRAAVGYEPNTTALAVLRIIFGLHVLMNPTNVLWPSTLPDALWSPPPGLLALLREAPPAASLIALQVVMGLVAITVAAGFKTTWSSVLLTLLLLASYGVTYSFGKVDHTILYALTPAALAAVGWGSSLSFDEHRSRHATRNANGFALLVWGIVVAFAFFTAAYPKLRAGWLDPSREATHGYVAREFTRSTSIAPLTDLAMSVDWSILWKAMDWFTLFAEGWLVVAVFFPALFRVGILLLSAFHVGVFLTLGIDFSFIAFVYAAFFMLPPWRWFSWDRRTSAPEGLAHATPPTRPGQVKLPSPTTKDPHQAPGREPGGGLVIRGPHDRRHRSV